VPTRKSLIEFRILIAGDNTHMPSPKCEAMRMAREDFVAPSEGKEKPCKQPQSHQPIKLAFQVVGING
jgi:hypothetical protein